MDQVEEMMEGLAIDESSFYWYVDLDYEFDACQYFDFSVEETKFEVQEADRWFGYARDYPPAPYMMKINLKNVFKTTPAKVDNLEAVEHTSSTITTPSDRGIHSSEGRIQDNSDMKCQNLIADIRKLKDMFKSANRLSKPTTSSSPSTIASASASSSTSFMKPTASHLAKKINADEIHVNSCGRSTKLQTPTGSETEDIKRQKLEIGFLRKVSQLNHQTSFSHKTTRKAATIPQKPKLMTEERARRRRSQRKVEAHNHTFKALPLNRKIFDSPSLPGHKKNMNHSCEFQKFHFKYDN